MQVMNNNSPSFGSIQVAISRMNSRQRGLSDKLFRTIKYTESYNDLSSEALDIYMLPGKKNGDIQVRFMDPYSGKFVRNSKGQIINKILASAKSEKVEEVADKIIDTFKKIINNTIERPRAVISDVINNNTEMAKINSDKSVDVSDTLKNLRKLGYTKKEAEEAAYEEYKSLYYLDNFDADF